MSVGSLLPMRGSPDEHQSDAFRDRSRAEFVYDTLREGIQIGRLSRGERVREEEVAHALGVSRTPVREALRRLEARGLLEMVGGRGLVVAELTMQQTLELYAMREVLEGSAARFAARHAADSEITALHRLLDVFLASRHEPAQLADLNRRFHRAIYEAAHNRYLIESLNQLHDALALLPGTTFALPGRPEAADSEHRGIVAAIERRDPEAAERAARDHIRCAQRARLEMQMAAR